MSEQKRVTLQDVLTYNPETYITKDDADIIQATFRGNDKLFQILRKVLLPSLMDSALPIEEFSKDAFSMGYDFSNVQVEHLKPLILARQDAIKFVMGGLIQLKVIANQPIESPYGKKKESNK